MWYGDKKDFGDKLVEDQKIRNYLNARINKGGISKIVIERTLGKLIITIHTSKPGIIIGKGGTEVDRIKEELKKLTKKEDVQINIMEIRRPELDAMIVGESIARQIEGRVSYKRAIKMAISTAIRMGAEGIKIKAGGRLNGAEIARSEEFKQGRTPLHTYRMDIDYASVYAMTVYGKIGLKIWICKGEVLGKRDLNPNFSANSDSRGNRPLGDFRSDGNRPGEGGRGGERGDRRGGDRRGGDDHRGGGGGDRRNDRGGNDRGAGGGGGERRPHPAGGGGNRGDRPGGNSPRPGGPRK